MPRLKKEGSKKPASKASKRPAAASHPERGRKKRTVENLAKARNVVKGDEQRTATQVERQATSAEVPIESIASMERAAPQRVEGDISIRADIDFTVSQIQRQSDWLASATFEDANIEIMKARLDILTTAWGKFELKSQELQQTSQNELQQADDITRQLRVEDVYVRVRAGLSQQIKALEPISSTATCTHANNRALQLRFAELPLADRLPIFRGNYREWIQFRDIFTAEVIRNPHITNLQRLGRLQNCVKEDAARAMGYWPQLEKSFAEAWKTLCVAFDNEYLCHAAHFSAIYGLPSWSRATHSLIRNMLDVTRNSMRMISRQLGAAEQRDLLILNFLESRLDSISRRQWEMVRPTDRIPNLQNDFFAWLERRISGLLSQGIQPLANHSEKRVINPLINQRMRLNASSVSNYNPCLNCSGDHAFHRCPGTGRMSREDKIKRIFELGLCQNCLRRGHTARNCLSSRCPRCARTPHNSIICPKLSAMSSKDEASRVTMLATVAKVVPRKEQ
ncbi:uncharacterized protein LOC118743254 isoform X2 [Rhagoletis pomonella]|uniref:uncharacterized protein LOC118743254 isoform X2 n=1 Tax=Rhagoletis pomonella TaxID=28610 RepID=UPI00177CF838|nr:uncharacterized protein LOC118743254 isoform X2 [Rhagoletis pomonella]